MLANKRDDGQGPLRDAIRQEKCNFLTLFKRGGGGGGVIPMFKNYVVNFV